MAKTKLKAKTKAKAKTFLPKSIGGVKVPKAARKGKVGAFIASPKGQALIAEVVMAGVGMLMAKRAKDSPKVQGALGDAKAKAGQTVRAAKKKVAAATSKTS